MSEIDMNFAGNQHSDIITELHDFSEDVSIILQARGVMILKVE